jgi:hypothetical protein
VLGVPLPLLIPGGECEVAGEDIQLP